MKDDLKLKPLYYVASPYTHKNKNVMKRRADFLFELGGYLFSKGIHTFVPIAYNSPWESYFDETMEDGLPTNFEAWAEFDLNYIARCDGVIVLKQDRWMDSRGVISEIHFALALGIPVYYMEVKDQNDPCSVVIPQEVLDASSDPDRTDLLQCNPHECLSKSKSNYALKGSVVDMSIVQKIATGLAKSEKTDLDTVNFFTDDVVSAEQSEKPLVKEFYKNKEESKAVADVYDDVLTPPKKPDFEKGDELLDLQLEVEDPSNAPKILTKNLELPREDEFLNAEEEHPLDKRKKKGGIIILP